MNDLECTTTTRVLTEAERASLRQAAEAFRRGQINQREVATGVWKLAPHTEE